MSWPHLIFLHAAVFTAAYLGSGLLVRLLARHAVLDRPNARSNHAVPVPRGGGLAVFIAVLPALTWAAMETGRLQEHWPVLTAAAFLVLISWLDDLRPIHPLPRLLCQAAAVGLCISGIEGLVFQGLLPPALDKIAAALLWLWFLNLYNFMDGIDGITGVETLSICLGVTIVIALTGGELYPYSIYAALLGTGMGAFLCWNWHPAKIFPGDAGSIPAGFLLGWLLLTMAAHGIWTPALILPAYYLADSGITIAKRIWRREKFWEAHSGHFYQRAVRAGKTHNRVARSIMCANAALIALAALSAYAGLSLPALAGAALTVYLLLRYLKPAR